MPDDTHEMHVRGEDVSLTLLGERRGGTRALDIETEDGRKWRIVVSRHGRLQDVETTWRDGELADLEEPDWLEDVLAQLARPA